MAKPIIKYPEVEEVEFAPVEVKGEIDLLERMKRAFPGFDDDQLTSLVMAYPEDEELRSFMKDFETTEQPGFKSFAPNWIEVELKRRNLFPGQKKKKPPETSHKFFEWTEDDEDRPIDFDESRWKKDDPWKPISPRDHRVLRGTPEGNDLFLFYREHGTLPRKYKSGYGSPSIEQPSRYLEDLPEKELSDPTKLSDKDLLKKWEEYKKKTESKRAYKELSKRQEEAAKDLDAARTKLTNKWISGEISPKDWAEQAIEQKEIEDRKKGIQYVGAEADDETLRKLLIRYYAVAGADIPPFPLLTATPYDDIEQINSMLEQPFKYKDSHSLKSIKDDFIKYVKKTGKGASLEDYLEKLSTQGEALLLIDNLKSPKTLKDVYKAENRIDKLYKDGKISDENREFLSDLINDAKGRFAYDREVAKAGGLVKYKKEEDKKAAQNAAIKLLIRNDSEIAKINDLRSRVYSAGVNYWMVKGKSAEDAKRIVKKEMDRLMPHFTLKYGVKVPAEWISTAALGIPGLYYEDGELIYDRSKWKALKNALKKQPVGTAYNNLVKKYQKEFKDYISPMAEDLAKLETSPLKEKIREKTSALSDRLEFQRNIKKIKGTEAIEGNLSWATRILFGVPESFLTSALSSLSLSTKKIPTDPVERSIFFNDLQKSGYKYLAQHNQDFDFIDQAIFNFSQYHTGQDLPGLFKAIAGPSIGEGKAATAGLLASLPLPLLGVGTTIKGLQAVGETVGKGGQAIGRFGRAQELSDIIKAQGGPLSKRGNQIARAGEILERWSTPKVEFLDRMRAKQIQLRLAHIGTAEEAKEAYKEAKKLSYENIGSNVAESMASVMAGRSSDIAIIKGLIDSGKLSASLVERIAAKNPGIAKMWSSAVQKQPSSPDIQTLENGAIKDFSEFVNDKWKTWEDNVSKGDPVAAANFNKSDYVRRVLKDHSKIVKSQQSPWLSTEDPLNKAVLDNLFSIMIRDYGLSKKEMDKFWKQVSLLKGQDRNPQKYGEIYSKATGVSLLPWDATVSQWREALETSLIPGWKDAVNNWLPSAKKANHYGGNTFGSPDDVTKESIRAYKREYESLLGKDAYVVKGDPLTRANRDLLSPADQIMAAGKHRGFTEVLTFQLKNWSKVEEFLKEEFRENISTFKGSNIYKELLTDVREGNPLSERQWLTLKDIVKKRLAKKHHKAFDVESEGDYTKLARTLFGHEVIKVGKEATEDTGKAFFGLGVGSAISAPFKTAVKSINSAISRTPQPMKAPLESSTPAFTGFVNKMNELSVNTDKEFQNTIRRITAEARDRGDANPLSTAINSIAKETWGFVKKDLDLNLDRIAQRNFGGSYKRLVNEDFIKKRGAAEGSSLKNQINEDVKAILEDPTVVSERMGFSEAEWSAFEESVYKKYAQDYVNYLNKIDVWESLMGSYFQVDIRGLSRREQKIFKYAITEGTERAKTLKGKEEALEMRTRASNIFTPTLDSFKLVSDELNKQLPKTFKQEKKLKTPFQQLGEKLSTKYKHDPTEGMLQIMNGWLLGSRKSIKGKEAFRDFLDKNPSLSVSYGDRPTIARVDPKPLLDSYSQLGNEIYDTLATKLGGEAAAKIFRKFLGVKAKTQVVVMPTKSELAELDRAASFLSKVSWKSDPDSFFPVPSIKGMTDEEALAATEKAQSILQKPIYWHGTPESELEKLSKLKPKELVKKTIERRQKLKPSKYGAFQTYYDEVFADPVGTQTDLMRDKFVDVFSKGMTNSHLNGIEKVSVKDMDDLASHYYAKGWITNTAYPDLGGLFGAMRENIKSILTPIGKNNVASLKAALKGYPDEIADEILSNFEKTNRKITATIMTGDAASPVPLLGGLQYNVMDNVKRAFDNVLKANGAMVGDNIVDLMKENNVLLHSTSLSDRMLAYGSDAEKTMEALKEIVESPYLRSASDYLKNHEDGKLVWNLLKSAVDFTRRTSVNGLLSGTILPGTRYMSNNLITAPLLTGNMGSGKAGVPWGLNPVAHKNAALINTMPSEKVLFTSKEGVPYTVGELRMLMSEYNLGYSKEALHMSKTHAQELMKETADLVAKDKSMPKKMKGFFKKHLNPADFNIYSKMAYATDQQFRTAVFFQALEKGGMTEAQAAKLARRSMLDYGAPDKTTSAFLSKLTLFWRFRVMMLAETVNMTARAIKNDKPNAVLSYLKYNLKIQQEAETWLYSGDDVHSRMHLPFAQAWKDEMKNNRKSVITAGPLMPQAESYEALMSVLSYPISLGKNMDVEQFAKTVIGQNYRPAINFTAKLIEEGFGKEGSKKLRDEYVNMFKAVGKWDWAKEFFELEPIPSDERSWTSAVWGPRSEQYRFRDGKEGQDKRLLFAGMQFLALMSGLDRHIRDYSTAAMAASEDSVDVRYQGMNKLNALYYLLGQSKVPLLEPGDVGKKSMLKFMRELKSLQDSYEKGKRRELGLPTYKQESEK